MKAVLFCARQNIALRGHRDDACHLQSPENNSGNFQNLLNLMENCGDDVLKEHFKNVPRNATYRSKTTQNNIIDISAKFVADNVVNEVKEAKYFSILADEGTDVSVKEQLSLVIRFVDSASNIREEFLGFIHCVKGTSGAAIADLIFGQIKTFGLDMNNCRGQGYDGAGNMSRIAAEFNLAFYFHCQAHQLNLCIMNACKLTQVHNMMNKVRIIHAFFDFPKRRDFLLQRIHKMMPESPSRCKLIDCCRTRWVQRVDALNDLFFCIRDVHIVNFADDNSPYIVDKSINEVLNLLEKDANKMYTWYEHNWLKPNSDKYHLLLSNQDINLELTINNEMVKNTSEVKLLGITLDNKFSCTKHVENICRKASKKLHALYRVCKYITQKQRRVIMKAFIESQFGYCPLVWIFHGNRTLNKTMNDIQERALKLVYNDYHSSFDQLLEKDGSYRIHHRNLQRLATEIYKFKHNLGPEILNEMFELQLNSYNTRSDTIIHTRAVKSVYNGTETVSYRAQMTWNMIPDDIKNVTSFNEFKTKIKRWKPTNCTCRLCQTYVNGIGFVDVVDQL